MKKTESQRAELRVVEQDDQFVIYKGPIPLKVRLSSGRRVGVQFSSRMVAESYIAFHQLIGGEGD
jgi:hypothetical protein